VRVSVRAVPGRTRLGDDLGEAARRGRFAAVECRVSDNGPGIPEADRERIFDPFYTTRDPGEGTGLGLSNALRFAEELGGRLTFEAGSGPGASFALQLPLAPHAGEEPVSVRGLPG
jgi:signal transduction histidine kinase